MSRKKNSADLLDILVRMEQEASRSGERPPEKSTFPFPFKRPFASPGDCGTSASGPDSSREAAHRYVEGRSPRAVPSPTSKVTRSTSIVPHPMAARERTPTEDGTDDRIRSTDPSKLPRRFLSILAPRSPQEAEAALRSLPLDRAPGRQLPGVPDAGRKDGQDRAGDGWDRPTREQEQHAPATADATPWWESRPAEDARGLDDMEQDSAAGRWAARERPVHLGDVVITEVRTGKPAEPVEPADHPAGAGEISGAGSRRTALQSPRSRLPEWPDPGEPPGPETESHAKDSPASASGSRAPRREGPGHGKSGRRRSARKTPAGSGTGDGKGQGRDGEPAARASGEPGKRRGRRRPPPERDERQAVADAPETDVGRAVGDPDREDRSTSSPRREETGLAAGTRRRVEPRPAGRGIPDSPAGDDAPPGEAVSPPPGRSESTTPSALVPALPVRSGLPGEAPGTIRSAVEALFGSDVVRTFRKPLEVRLGTLVVGGAVGIVVVLLAVGYLRQALAPGAEGAIGGGADPVSGQPGGLLSLGELMLPEVIPPDPGLLPELRHVTAARADSGAPVSADGGGVDGKGVDGGGAPTAQPDPAELPETSYFFQVQAHISEDHPNFRALTGYLDRLGFRNVYKFPEGGTTADGMPFYELRVGPYPSYAEARKACDRFLELNRKTPFSRLKNLQDAFTRRVGRESLLEASAVRS